jgi:hypothetical protein
MTAISKRNLMKGSAALAVATSVVPLAAKADGMVELERLIAAHRATMDAFHKAIDREQEAEEAYKALGVERVLVPNLLSDGKLELLSRDFVEEELTRDLQRLIRSMRPLERNAPDIAKRARRAIGATFKENMRLLDKAIAEEGKRKDTVGLRAAKRELDEISDAEEDALLALCAYPCRSMEEARRKSEYLTEHLKRGCEITDEQRAL